MRVPPASDTLYLFVRGIEADGRDATRLGSQEPGAAIAARAHMSESHEQRDNMNMID